MSGNALTLGAIKPAFGPRKVEVYVFTNEAGGSDPSVWLSQNHEGASCAMAMSLPQAQELYAALGAAIRAQMGVA